MLKLKQKCKNALKKYRSIPIAVKAGMWFVACTMLQKSISFITVPIFTRLMPTAEYGLYSTYLSWYAIFTVFCTMNLQNVVYVNNYVKGGKDKDKEAIPLLSLSFVVTIFLFTLYLLFHRYLDAYIKLPSSLVYLMFIQILFEPPVNFWTQQQRFEYKYLKLVIRTISMVLMNTILGIVFVWLANEHHSAARVSSLVLVQIFYGGAFYLYFWKRAKQIFSTRGWKHALKVQLPLLPHSLSLIVLSSSDRIMINNMVGSAEAGIYSVAYSAGYVVNVLKSSIVDALRPWIYRKIKSEDYISIRKTVNIVIIFVMLITVLFTGFAPEIIYIMAPAQYHEAVYVIPPVAASSFFILLYNVFSIVGMYYEKTKKIMWASITGAALNLVLNYFCIKAFGYIAAAYTTLVCYVFFSFAHYFIMRTISNEYLNGIQIFDVRFIFIMSITTVLISILFTFTYDKAFVRLGIIGVAFIIAIIKRKTFISTIKDMRKKS